MRDPVFFTEPKYSKSIIQHIKDNLLPKDVNTGIECYKEMEGNICQVPFEPSDYSRVSSAYHNLTSLYNKAGNPVHESITDVYNRARFAWDNDMTPTPSEYPDAKKSPVMIGAVIAFAVAITISSCPKKKEEEKAPAKPPHSEPASKTPSTSLNETLPAEALVTPAVSVSQQR